MLRIDICTDKGSPMKRLKYNYLRLGILPCDLLEIKDIAAHLLGSSHSLRKVDGDDSLMTALSYAKPRNRETFVSLIGSVPSQTTGATEGERASTRILVPLTSHHLAESAILVPAPCAIC